MSNKIEFPVFPVKDQPDYDEFLAELNKKKEWQGLAEDAAYLRYWCEKEFSNKVPKGKEDQYRKQLEEEFEVFEYRDFSSYMLVVADYVNWAKKNGIMVGPGRGCLTGDTLVLTNNGFVELQDIKVNNKVYTHNGSLKKVKSVFKYDINETLISLKTNSFFERINLTTDHKVLALTKNSDFPSWIEAAELNKGDTIVFPKIDRKIKKTPCFDLGKYIKKNCKHSIKHIISNNSINRKVHLRNNISVREVSRNVDVSYGTVLKAKNNIKVDNSCISKIEKYLLSHNYTLEQWINEDNYFVNKCNRYYEFNENFAYLVGRWVGDGCFHGGEKLKGVTISFNKNDIVGIYCVENILNSYNILYSLSSTKKNSVNLTISDSAICGLFKDIFCDYERSSKTKHLPLFFRELPDNVLFELLRGLFDADGYFDKKIKRHVLKTTSYRLIKEVKEVFLYLGIKTTMYCERSPKRNGKITNPAYVLYVFLDKEPQALISDISKTNSYKEVYDLEIEGDHSYVTIFGTVHNSCGGSLTGYLLGIHLADPILFDLPFSRFLNKNRPNPPDIDLDFAPSGRAKVQEYIANKYGVECTAHVSNINTITPKVYVRDVCRTFEFGESRKEAVKIGNEIADTIPNEIKTIKQALDPERCPLFALYAEQYPELAEFADTVAGKARAWSTHAGGLIVAGRPLAEFVPIRRDVHGNVSIELDKDRAEEIGLVKMDTLGLETLDIIDETYRIIKSVDKQPPEDLFDYLMEDEKAYDLICEGDVFCVFQLTGVAASVCKALKPRNVEEIALVTALIRPSSKAIIDDFMKVRSGERPLELIHPFLERALKQTYGFALFEDVLIYIAADVAGWDLHESDDLRKMTKSKGKYPEKVKKLKDKFIEDAVKNNIDRNTSIEIWSIVESFGSYGFNKSHAILYSMISFQTAYLKAHYPLEFLVANLMSEVNSNAKIAKDNILKIKDEIRSLGVKIVPPDINTSDMSYKIIDDNTLMTGLDSLKYMGKDSIPEILDKRPFNSFEDFLAKVDGKKVRAPAVQALAASGCLDAFKLSRKQMFLYASDFKKKLQVHLKKKDAGEFNYPWPEEGDWNSREKYALEEYYLGEGMSGNVHERFEGFFDRHVVNFPKLSEIYPFVPPPERDLEGLNKEDKDRKVRKFNTHIIPDRRVKALKGIITSLWVFKVKKEDSPIRGQEMARLIIQDPWGDNLTVLAFPDLWQSMQSRIKELSGGKYKIDTGMAIGFNGSFQWENEHTYSFIIGDILGFKEAPEIPADLKSRKVKMPRAKKKKKIEDMDKESLAEELEDEMIDNGISPIDDDDEYIDPFN